MSFVFHGGSGSSLEDIRYAIEAGVVKMNIDTDTQWAFWDGMNEYQKKNKDYLQAQKLGCYRSGIYFLISTSE